MPQFDITSPEGKKFRVTAPEGATREQVLAYAQQQFAEKPVEVNPNIPADQVELHKARLAEAEKGLAAIKPEAPSTLAGIGRGFTDVGQGVKQAALQLTDPEAAKKYTADTNKEIELYEKGRGPDAGIDWPRMGGNMAATAPLAVAGPAGLAARVIAGGAAGAAQGAVQFDPTGDSRLENAAVGGAAGAVLPGAGALVKKGAKALSSGMTEGYKAALATADKLGIQTDAAQKTGNKLLDAVASTTGKVPLSGAEAAARTSQNQFNRALAGTTGEVLATGENQLTPAVMNRAAKRVGGEFEKLSNGKAVPITTKVYEALDKVAAENDSSQMLRNPQIAKLIEQARSDFAPSTPGGQRMISGEEAQALRSRLTQEAFAASKSQAPGANQEAKLYRSVRDAIDDSIHSTLSPEESATWNTAKKHWGNLKTLEIALSGSAGESGDVSGVQLWNAVKSNIGRKNVARSTSDLKKLAEVGKDVLRTKTPDSGTALRSALYQVASTVGTAAVGSKIGEHTGHDKITSGAAGLAAGALTSRALRNQFIAQAIKDGALPATAAKLTGEVQRAITAALIYGQTKPNVEKDKRRLQAEALRN